MGPTKVGRPSLKRRRDLVVCGYEIGTLEIKGLATYGSAVGCHLWWRLRWGSHLGWVCHV